MNWCRRDRGSVAVYFAVLAACWLAILGLIVVGGTKVREYQRADKSPAKQPGRPDRPSTQPRQSQVKSNASWRFTWAGGADYTISDAVSGRPFGGVSGRWTLVPRTDGMWTLARAAPRSPRL